MKTVLQHWPVWVVTIPGRRQSKMQSTIDERGSKIDRNSVFDCHLSPSKTLFLLIFDLRSLIVLAFSIAAYPVWLESNVSTDQLIRAPIRKNTCLSGV